MSTLAAVLSVSTVCAPARAAAVPKPTAVPKPAGAAETVRAVDATVAQRLDTIVERGAAPTGTAPGVSVAVIEGGKIVYAHAAGFEDVAAQRRATTQTRFRIGSVTKMFTAVTIMQLVERGVVHLDDRLATYLPAVAHARDITVRQLLMHTSGVANYADDAFNSGAVKTATTPDAIIASMAGPLQFTPGTKYAYSNTGYVLLGQVIEHVTGEPLAQYERTHIFVPAGMHDTSEGILSVGAGTAVGYMDAKAAPVAPFDASWLYADGDIVSTASDLARFDIALMNGTLISWSSLVQMRADPVATETPGVTYGLGTMMFSLGNLNFISHHGGLPGFESDNLLLPEQQFAVVALGNSFTFATGTESGPILATLFPATSARATSAVAVKGAKEEPAVTARLRALFTALQTGRVDRSELSDEMNTAITPAALATLTPQLAALGSLQSLKFLNKETGVGGTARSAYTYSAVFSAQTLTVRFVLDPDGKVAGFFFL